MSGKEEQDEVLCGVLHCVNAVCVNGGVSKGLALLLVLLHGWPHLYSVHVHLHLWNMHPVLLLARSGNGAEQLKFWERQVTRVFKPTEAVFSQHLALI